VLKEIGVPVEAEPPAVERMVEEGGIGFMLAPVFHPAMKAVIGPRQELGMRTIFNVLGPLTNPAGAERLVVGVYDEDLVAVLARTLARMDAERALVVHGSGLDEIAVHGETTVAEVDGDDVEEYTLTPESLGVGRHEVSSIAGGQPEENAADLEGVVTGEVNGAKRDIILANAGAGIYIAGEASSIEDGVEQARRTIDSGDAAAKMEELRAVGRLGATASD
jgi:anthranilate phosphoribosyltransferase